MTTPMMQQYRDAKARHPGMLLLFRMGDFYELFEDDAELAARILGLTLTSRDKVVPMAGFPHHALDGHLRKLLQAGHRVAVCDQVEDAAQAKGLVKREVTRVVTPGTVTEDELLDPRRPNHLVALAFSKAGVGVAWADLSTGTFQAARVSPDRLADELARISAAECLLAESDLARHDESLRAALPSTVATRPDWTFDPATARAALFAHFGVATLAGFGFDDASPCVTAAGGMVIYLQETLRSKLAHLRRLEPYAAAHVLALDEVTRRSLELTRTLRDGSRDGSLLAVIDRTVTTMGARLLHDWILAPLTDLPTITARQDAVGEFLAEFQLRADVREVLRESSDLQRLTARVSTGRATPRDLAAVARTLRLLPRLKARLTGRNAGLLEQLEARLDLCPDLRELLDSALTDDPPLNPRGEGIIRPGFHAEFDELKSIAREAKDWIVRYQAQEIARTGIQSLKVGYNQVFGYYIELTDKQAAANEQKIPPEYKQKQSLKNARRYYTPELKEHEEKVLSAEERLQTLEQELFARVREQTAARTRRLLETAEVLATLDVLAGLAEVAAARNYVCPELTPEPVLMVSDGRHPVLDQTLPPGTFVPNDVALGGDGGRLWLITGPNMAGKSTYIRQIALLTLLAHVGSFVPAKAARIGCTDRIFTRVGASDELSRGQSTFMVEMTEAANILNNATPRSLVILDEIGRGTSTYDGVSLAWAITEHLHERGCRTLFATHYHELARLSETLPHLRNYNVQVHEAADEVVFLHKIGPGSADKSYGIHVARLAGVPEVVLGRAEQVLAELESRPKPPPPAPPPAEPSRPERKKRRATAGPSLFAADGETTP